MSSGSLCVRGGSNDYVGGSNDWEDHRVGRYVRRARKGDHAVIHYYCKACWTRKRLTRR